MRAILLYFLVFQLLSTNQLGVELMKVPQLLQHYREHCAEDGQMSLTHFLYLHYGEIRHEHKNNAAHGSLPLKAAHAAASIVALPVAFTTTFFPSSLAVALEAKPDNFPPLVLLEAQYLLAIFQPPRV
jgi:hypothetical protein